eukprot:5461659-Prymnesium_polylepis.3
MLTSSYPCSAQRRAALPIRWGSRPPICTARGRCVASKPIRRSNRSGECSAASRMTSTGYISAIIGATDIVGRAAPSQVGGEEPESMTLWPSRRRRGRDHMATWPMAYGAPCGGSGRYARPA